MNFGKKKTDGTTPDVEVTTEYVKKLERVKATLRQVNGASTTVEFEQTEWSSLNSIKLPFEMLDELEQLVKWAKEMRDGNHPEAVSGN